MSADERMSNEAVIGQSISCEEVQDLIPAYVLGMLDAEETALVETHLPLCPACTAELVRFEAVTGALAAPLPPVAPTPALRVDLLDRAAELRPAAAPAAAAAPVTVAPPAKVIPLAARRRADWRVWVSAAAAVLIILGGGLGYWMREVINDRNEAQTTAAMLTEFMAPGSSTMELPALAASDWGDKQGVSKLMKDPSGNMIVAVANCPPSTAGRVYKVWVAIGDDRVVVGDMTIGADGSGWMPVSFPSEMQHPDILGVSMLTDGTELTDLFIGTMSG
jgi:hypothetical protein